MLNEVTHEYFNLAPEKLDKSFSVTIHTHSGAAAYLYTFNEDLLLQSSATHIKLCSADEWRALTNGARLNVKF